METIFCITIFSSICHWWIEGRAYGALMFRLNITDAPIIKYLYWSTVYNAQQQFAAHSIFHIYPVNARPQYSISYSISNSNTTCVLIINWKMNIPVIFHVLDRIGTQPWRSNMCFCVLPSELQVLLLTESIKKLPQDVHNDRVRCSLCMYGITLSNEWKP